MTVKAIQTHERSPCQQQMVADVSEFLTGDLIGYVVMTFYKDGSTQSSCWRPNAEDHGLGHTMFEAWAKETLVSQFEYAGATSAARDVLNGDA